MKFSIIIVTYNNHKALFNCLESISRCNVQHPFEVVVIFNGDRTYLKKCSQTFKNFSLNYIHKTTPASARNFGISKATGEFAFFLNDDCTVPSNYFSSVNFEKDWDVLGGPDQTPLQSSPFQKIIGRAFSSPLCMGPAYKRHTTINEYQTDAPESSFILSNIWFKTSLFNQEQFHFNPKLYRNELIQLLKELKNKGKTLHYNSSMFVFQQRKKNLENLGAQVIFRGESRMQGLALMPQKNDLLFFLPLVWLFFFVQVIFRPQSILSYGFICYGLLVALYYAVKHRGFSLQYIFLHFFIVGSYSVGLIIGFWKFYPVLYNNLRVNKSLINESKSK